MRLGLTIPAKVSNERASKFRVKFMSRKCQISKKGTQRGCNISHSHNKTLRTWDANLHWKRLYDSESKKWVRLRVSARILRTIDRKGLAATLKDHGLTLKDLVA